jgi:3'-phosphoadenosine 5'-phosphosulfate sulfotransferase (PAPS reductase)/FAD synthetase
MVTGIDAMYTREVGIQDLRKLPKRLRKLVSASLRTLYKVSKIYNEYPWEIGFSGGKDSTVVCHLVMEYLKRAIIRRLPKPSTVHIVYSDTLLDVPILRQHTLQIISDIKRFSQSMFSDLIQVHILKPKEGQDFFSLMIERGYPAPHRRFRWCMDRLKIDPITSFLGKIGKCVMITGVRRDESIDRARNMVKRGQTHTISTMSGVIIVAPILFWKAQDVWSFLRICKQPWNGNTYEKLEAIYRATDVLRGCTGGCQIAPNNRFGCWVCTVVQRDKMLERLGALYPRYSLLHSAKEEIRKISLTPQYRERKPDGTYGRLNEAGRRAVASVISKLYPIFPEAFEGYLEDAQLREKLFKWISIK